MCVGGGGWNIAKRNIDSVPGSIRHSVRQQTRAARYSTPFLDPKSLIPEAHLMRPYI